MSKPKFKVGDRAGTRDGRTWRVREVSSAGTGVLLVTEKDVKPYESSWFAVDTLSKPRARTEAKIEPTDWTATFRDDRDPQDVRELKVEVKASTPEEAAAIAGLALRAELELHQQLDEAEHFKPGPLVQGVAPKPHA